MKIEQLVLSIATNQFTVPLPTGKDVVRAVNSHAALVAALKFKLAVNHAHSCFCARCEKARAALQAASK